MPKPKKQSAIKSVSNKATHKWLSFKAIKYYLICAVILVVSSALFLDQGSASNSGNQILSGYKGYCLDDYHDRYAQTNPVQVVRCNNSAAQSWQLSMSQIKHGNNYCLSVGNNSEVIVTYCSDSAKQIWLRYDKSYINPDSGLCLTADNLNSNNGVDLDSCGGPNTNSQEFTPSNFDYMTYKCSGDQGQLVACNAIKQYIAWNQAGSDHNELLNEYTGGAPYEEWCADFISYVFKNAGYPFNKGSYNSWDENNALNIQNMGFSYHDVLNYTPKAGDVAFFNYGPGHVEIIIGGGVKPTFIYGNSANIDPTTNNGEMASNTITNLGSKGQVIYYLSPTNQT